MGKKYDDSEYVDIENNSSDNESIPEEDSNMSSESESEDLPKGWTIETQKRKKGKRREGKPDRFYVSPEGKKYRSRAQMLRIDELLNASKKSSPKKKPESVERSISSRKRKSVEKPKATEIADSDDEEEPITPKKKAETPKKKTPEKKSKSSNSSSSTKKRKTSKKDEEEEEEEEQEEEEIEEEEEEKEESEEDDNDDVSEDEVERQKKSVNEEEEEEIEEENEEEESKSIEWEPSQISSQIEDFCLKLKDYFLCKLKNTSSLKPEKFTDSMKFLLNKIVSESKSEDKEKVARLLVVLESVTQSLIHCYPFEYEEGQDMLQLLWDVWRETLIVADSCAIPESTLRKHIQFIVEHDRTFLFKHFPLIEKKPNSGTPSKGKSTLNAKMFTQVKGLLKDCIGPIFCTSVHAWQFAENDFKRRKSLMLAMKHFERNPLPNSKVSRYQDFSSLGKWVELVIKENLIEELRNMLKSVAHRSSFYVRKLFWLFTPLDPAFTFLNAEKELKRVAPHIVHELSKRYFNIYPHAKEDAKNWLNLKKNFKSESEITFLDHLLTTFGHNAANGSTKALETHFSKQKDVEFGGEDFTPSSEINCPSYYRGVLGWIKLAQYAIEKRAPDTKFEFEHREFPTLDSLILWWKENLTHHLKESDDELIPIVAPNISSKENNEWTKLSHLFNAYNRDEDFVKFLTNAVNSFF